MKTTPLIPLLSLLLLLHPGCASSPKKAAHRTLEAVGLSVQKSMQSAAAGVRAGKLTPEDWVKVVAIHDTQFLPAYRRACELAAQDFGLWAPENILAIEVKLLALINTFLKP